MRRSPIAWLIVFIGVLFLALNGWSLTCGDTSTGAAPPGSVNLFRISDTHNAHVQDMSQVNYPYTVYCTPGAGETIAAGNGTELMRITTPDNAHAELTSGSNNYPISITLRSTTSGHQILSLIVNASTGDSCAAHNAAGITYTELIRLARTTNSHVQSKNYSGPQSNYNYRVCVAYDSGAGGGTQPNNHIILTNITNTPVNVAMNGSFNANILTTNQVAGDSDYANITSTTVTVMCQSGVGNCDTLATADYDAILQELNLMSQPGYLGTLLPATLQITKFGNASAAQNTFVNNMNAQYPTNQQSLGELDTITGTGNDTHSRIYNVNPMTMGLVPGDYIIISLSWRGNFNFPLSNPSNRDEGDYTTTNIKTVSFNIPSTCGDTYVNSATEACDPPGFPGGCPALFTCNNTCTSCINSGPGTQGMAGDVYILKDISFPNVYTNNNIVAELTIENKDTTLTGANPNATVNVIIRDSKGIAVGAFNPAQFIRVINGAVDVETILIQAPAAPFLNVGETYTLYATVVPYDNANPSLDEKIVTNNSGFKTFTAINAPQAYSVPDSPWWMSALIVFSIIGFLFAQSKKETKN